MAYLLLQRLNRLKRFSTDIVVVAKAASENPGSKDGIYWWNAIIERAQRDFRRIRSKEAKEIEKNKLGIALIFAVMSNQPAVVATLLEAGAKIKPDEAIARLYIAAGYFSAEILRASLLHRAVYYNNSEMIKWLITYGVETALVVNGKTPVLYAVGRARGDRAYWKSVRAITRAKPAVTLEEKNAYGLALYYAIANDENTVALELLKAGASVTDYCEAGTGNTLLHMVVSRKELRSSKLTRELIKKGADRNFKNRQGLTPLQLAWNLLKMKDERYHYDHIYYLSAITTLAEMSESFTVEEEAIYADALVKAIAWSGDREMDSERIVKALLTKIPRLIEISLVGNGNLLHWAVENKRSKMVSCLLRCGVDQNKKDSAEEVPYGMALRLAQRNPSYWRSVAILIVKEDEIPVALIYQDRAAIKAALQDVWATANNPLQQKLTQLEAKLEASFFKVYNYFLETYAPGKENFEARLTDFANLLAKLKCSGNGSLEGYAPRAFNRTNYILFSGTERYQKHREEISALSAEVRRDDLNLFIIAMEADAAVDKPEKEFVFARILVAKIAEKVAEIREEEAARLRATAAARSPVPVSNSSALWTREMTAGIRRQCRGEELSAAIEMRLF